MTTTQVATMTEKRVLDLEQAAEILHIQKGTLRNWLSENRQGIRKVGRKVGGQWLFLEDSLLGWIDRQKDKQ